MRFTKLFTYVFIAVVSLSSCKKDNSSKQNYTNEDILKGFAVNVAQGTYRDLSSKSEQLYVAITTFKQNATDSNLNQCRQLWKDARSAWEQSEGFLFGPVSTEDIDPRIDTWPVDYNSLDSVLNSSSVFDAAYIDALDDALKGFHPIEYLLWGSNGHKTSTVFTAKEFDYLIALASNLKNLTNQLESSWDAGGYYDVFTTAGNGNHEYPTQRAAFLELVSAMASICEEVADGKINDPLVAQDASLEESPFSENSIADFTNNIRSVDNVYRGKYSTQGKSLEDMVRNYNLSLDAKIKTAISNAIAALNAITVPFGQAIFTQQPQVIQAQNAITQLRQILDNDLTTLVNQRIEQ